MTLLDIPGTALDDKSIDTGAEATEFDSEEFVDPPLPPLRVGLVVGTSTLAAAVVVGTLFDGVAGHLVPALAGVVGIGVAAQASRRRRPAIVNLTIGAGIVGTGLALLLPDVSNLSHVVSLLREAGHARHVLRPPAQFLPGFRLIVGWLMCALGFTAGWLGIELRRPAMGLVAPLPIVVVGAISVPDSLKLPVGIIVLVLFLTGLTLLGSLQNGSSEGETMPSLGYELRRAAKVVPLIAILSVAMIFLAKSNLLFPKPLYDPVRDSQRPKAVPLSEVKDEVLFQVRSRSTGPWRIGLLDVYDGKEWRIPAFSESSLKNVPRNGVVDKDLQPSTRADFLVKALGGAVLPGLPNTVGVVAQGPKLGYDPRTGAIRLVEGQIRSGLAYAVSGAATPTEDQLRNLTLQLRPEEKRFLAIPKAPPAVQQLLDEAPKAPAWERLQFVRRRLLETVTAAGPGVPVAVPPSRVDDMLAGSKEASPFEIVAAQAMLARWAGVPARIGYGYDGGDLIGEGVREIHPAHGASWLEVYFAGFKWLPLIGSPRKAKPSLSSDAPTNADPKVVASDNIAVQVFIPLRVPQRGFFYDEVRHLLKIAVPLLLLAGTLYVCIPIARKDLQRRRRRRWAALAGPVAAIQVAYAEFRDLCTDLGIGATSSTPLAFVDDFVADREHRELAWLVTRCLYGDLRDHVDDRDADAAHELAASMRRRVSRAQPPSLRAIGLASRLSLRDPYAAEVRPPTRREQRRGQAA